MKNLPVYIYLSFILSLAPSLVRGCKESGGVFVFYVFSQDRV